MEGPKILAGGLHSDLQKNVSDFSFEKLKSDFNYLLFAEKLRKPDVESDSVFRSLPDVHTCYAGDVSTICCDQVQSY